MEIFHVKINQRTRKKLQLIQRSPQYCYYYFIVTHDVLNTNEDNFLQL